MVVRVCVYDGISQSADIIVFPEFGLFGDDGLVDHCKTPSTEEDGWCGPMDVAAGDVPCTTASVTNAALAQASCNSRNASLAASVNMCERGADGNNWNTQVVFDSNGAVLAKVSPILQQLHVQVLLSLNVFSVSVSLCLCVSLLFLQYRKTHPWDTKCFAAPATPDLVMFNFTVAASEDPITFGVFTCKDILYSTPGPELAEKYGIKNFLYSSAIPLVASDALELWSSKYHATVLASNLQLHQSGVFQRGHRLTEKPGDGNVLVMIKVDL